MAQATNTSRGKTPLMRQYWKIKDQYPRAILLFRMGDFYEAFEDDAKLISSLLGIQLTTRSNGAADDVPMAGFPHHSLDNYLPKLIREGHRVAVCEQVEDAEDAGKVVDRDVVEVVTPGVSFHDQLLDPKRSNYLAAVHWGTKGQYKGWAGFSFIDATTGEFAVTEVPAEKVDDLLETIAPSELLFDKRQRDRVDELRYDGFVGTRQEDWVFGYDFAYETLLDHFETHSLKGFGVDDLNLGLIAAGAALHYLTETQKGKVPHIQRIARFEDREYMSLDPETKRNLELVASLRGGGREGSLIEILDRTETPMGGRLLRRWLVQPLRQKEDIDRRLAAVDALFSDDERREDLRGELEQVGDLERLISKVCTGRARPRDLINLKLTLRQIPPIKTLVEQVSGEALEDIAGELRLCKDVVDHIDTALVDDPPNKISEGGLVSDGYSEELDELRQIAASGKEWVSNLEEEESERTNIPSLKVGFNKVFGYYIEVTKTHTEKVPESYIRKQTLVNSERYITPELKEYEEKILSAEEKIERLEQRLFNELRMAVAEKAEPIQRDARLLAELDCFSALARTAHRLNYVRPEVHEGRSLDIRDGRHPVVEQTLPAGEPFIPNDVKLDPSEEQIMIVTGPNMAGKSVVLRQTGLIVLLAQVGSFVPAAEASIGIVDKIFTRVGASDNLAAGESTFLVEMNETANILNNATPDSLILLDEVGRGTSTFDGLSIAWALVEYLHENARVAARTLFATHYHELNALAERYDRVRNARIKVKEHDGDIIFLRKLIPGGADHSYGIEVARMAGLPDPVIDRAREVLKHLEAQDLAMEESGETPAAGNGQALPEAKTTNAASTPPPQEGGAFQTSLFESDPVAAEIKASIDELEPNAMTPIEALMKLAELKQRIEEGGS